MMSFVPRANCSKPSMTSACAAQMTRRLRSEIKWLKEDLGKPRFFLELEQDEGSCGSGPLTRDDDAA